MKQLFISILLLTGTLFHTAAQTAEGDWYTPIRNKLIRITVSADSIVCRKWSFDSTAQSYQYPSEIFRIIKKPD